MPDAEKTKTYHVPASECREWQRYLWAWNVPVEETLALGLQLLVENTALVDHYKFEFDGPSSGVRTQVKKQARHERKTINTTFSPQFQETVSKLSRDFDLSEGVIVGLAIQCLLLKEEEAKAPNGFLENGVKADAPSLNFTPHSEKLSNLIESREVFVDRTVFFAGLFITEPSMRQVHLTCKALLERGCASKITLYSTAVEIAAVSDRLTLQADVIGFGKFVRVLRIVPVSAPNFLFVHPGLPKAREAKRPANAKIAVEACLSRSLDLIFATVSDDFDGLLSPKLIAKP